MFQFRLMIFHLRHHQGDFSHRFYTQTIQSIHVWLGSGIVNKSGVHFRKTGEQIKSRKSRKSNQNKISCLVMWGLLGYHLVRFDRSISQLVQLCDLSGPKFFLWAKTSKFIVHGCIAYKMFLVQGVNLTIVNTDFMLFFLSFFTLLSPLIAC